MCIRDSLYCCGPATQKKFRITENGFCIDLSCLKKGRCPKICSLKRRRAGDDSNNLSEKITIAKHYDTPILLRACNTRKNPNYRIPFLHRFILLEKRALFKQMWSPEGAHTHIKPHEFSIIPASAGDTPASAGDIPASSIPWNACSIWYPTGIPL